MAFAVAAMVAFAAAYLFFQAKLRGTSKVIYELTHHPKDILWVYSFVYQRMPFGFQMSSKGLMYFKMTNNREICVALPSKDLKMVSRFLNRVLPHAMFGYSKEKAAQYQKILNP